MTAAVPVGADVIGRVLGRRLELAVEVARTKWNTKAPIEDLAREAQAIDAIGVLAVRNGVDPAVAVELLKAQIEAGKVVQRALHERWTAEANAPFASVQDLAAVLRPQFDQLSVELVAWLAAVGPAPGLDEVGLVEADRTMRSGLDGVPLASDAVRVALEPLRGARGVGR